jgi:hypothetical protein
LHLDDSESNPNPRNNNIYVPSTFKEEKDLKEQTLQQVLQSKKPCKFINQERNEKGKCVKSVWSLIKRYLKLRLKFATLLF